jgi:hypothetical protein
LQQVSDATVMVVFITLIHPKRRPKSRESVFSARKLIKGDIKQ